MSLKQSSLRSVKKPGYEQIASRMGHDNSAIMDKIDILLDSKLEERLEIKIKPLQQKISELEAENRRMKIALRFLESELKDCVKSKNNHHTPSPKSLYTDPKRRGFSVKSNELPQSDPKKLKLLDDGPKSFDPNGINDKTLADYTKLPESIHKIQLANEERIESNGKSHGDNRSKTTTTCNSLKTSANHLYLAIPSTNNSTNLVPLVLQSAMECGSPLGSSSQVTSSSLKEKPRADELTPITSQSSLALVSKNQEKTVTPEVSTNGSKDLEDITMDDDEIEVVPLPPPKPPLAVIDLSDEEDGDSTNNEVSEILPGPECHMHPMVSPSLPFVVSSEEEIPPPTLKARTGRGKDGKKAVVLRMESKISGIQNLQYRVFSYFENPSETQKDRRWKQLTCIKVQSGRVCECTLTHLMEKVKYHFVVCLVQGNNRSKFSNCAPHVY